MFVNTKDDYLLFYSDIIIFIFDVLYDKNQIFLLIK
jgi:hypothetical protein